VAFWAAAIMAFEPWIASRNRWVCDDTFVGIVDGYSMIMTLFYGFFKKKDDLGIKTRHLR